jgi:16S rRNA processing protein RimM
MSVEFLAIGRVLRPHGVRGDLLLETLTEFPDRLQAGDSVFLGETAVEHTLATVRLHRQQLIIRLEGCQDRDCAEAYRGLLVQIRAAAASPLPPGRYYHHQLIGLRAVSDEGELLGTLTKILETGANDVYIVSGPNGDLLLPAIRSVILDIDLESGQMTVHLLEGLR